MGLNLGLDMKWPLIMANAGLNIKQARRAGEGSVVLEDINIPWLFKAKGQETKKDHR